MVLTLGACSSDSSGESLTTTTGAGEASTSTTVVITRDLDEQMCRTLELLKTAGVPAPSAAASIETVDLGDATSPERTTYGDLLISAPGTYCPESMTYADDIAYWLGY